MNPDLDVDHATHTTGERTPAPRPVSPGRATLTSRMPASAASIARAVVAQLKAEGAATESADPLAVAAHGTSSGGGTLPHLAAIQRSFGHHDVRDVSAHVGGAAAEASAALGARAYAVGDAVAFASAPDLHLAAHEAAHVVQQRGGVRLSGGVGRAGDEYERHADEVADRVTRGESAEALLDQYAHRGARGGPAVQRVEGESAPPSETRDDSAGGEVPTEWLITYDNVFRGQRREPTSRTPDSALTLVGFDVTPARGPQFQFAGVALRPTGPVTMGRHGHARDAGGRAESTFRYQQIGDLHLRIELPTPAARTAARNAGGAIALRDRVSQALRARTDLTGDISAVGTELLPADVRAAGVRVAGEMRAGGDRAHTASTAYAAIRGETRMLARVTIPTSTADATGGSTQTQHVEHELDTERGGGSTQTDQVEQSRTQTETRVREIEHTFNDQTERFARTAVQRLIGGELEAHGQLNLGVQLSQTLAASLPLAAIVAAIAPELAPLLGDLEASISSSTTGQVTGGLEAGARGRIHGQLTRDQENSLRRAFTQGYRDLWRSDVQTAVTETVTHSTQRTDTSRDQLRQEETTDRSSTGTRTTHYEAVSGVPRLEVTAMQ